MHIDLEHNQSSATFHSSVCILGAGIAGLTLATRLAAHGIDVHLLEAGGLATEDRSQSLYRAEMAAEQHRGVHEGRFRLFGGSSTQWGGQLLPFTHDIFDPPAGTGTVRWPIDDSELTPFYDDVQRILGVDPLPFTEELLPALGHPALPPSNEIRLRYSKWAPFNRRNLAQTLGQQAIAHAKITLFTHANVAGLCADPSDRTRIGSARVLNYSRREFTFTASHFIVCTGTIESSRLLLCSPDVPNPHDQIGRYFHDHLSFHVARFLPPTRERIIDRLGPFYVDGTLHTCKLEASPELRGREHLLAVMAHLIVVEPEDSGVAAVRNMLRSLQHGRLKEAIVTNLLPTLRGASDVARLAYYSRFKKRRAISRKAALYLTIDLEQPPNPDNRIRLSPNHTDALGLPVTVVDWRIGAPEKDTAARFIPLIRSFLQSLDLEPQQWESGLPPMTDTLHPMGGLRMGDDPAASVVDRDLTVHGLTNLSVASCAVFPSGSSSNPTFTMMALSLRLADRLAATQPQSLSGQGSHEASSAPAR
jgi:choline dehydrogenase-like flavoprotein